MAIKISASNNFLSTFVDIINVFDCRLPGVRPFIMHFIIKYIGYTSHAVAQKNFTMEFCKYAISNKLHELAKNNVFKFYQCNHKL